VIGVTSINALIDARSSFHHSLPGLEQMLSHSTGLVIYITNLLGLVLLFTLLYKIMPVATVSFRRALAGGITAAILWEITRYGLVAYFTRVSIVNVLYGSIATTIIVLLTMEAVALILLLGAQVIADLQRSANLGLRWYEDPEKLVGGESRKGDL
jgi:YihY family inner membrane protein